MCPRFDRQPATAGTPAIFALRLALAAVTVLIVALPALSAAEQGAAGRTQVEFDIPSQPLASALERYGDATGREVLYDSNLAIGRRSTAVAGPMTPEVALYTLLDGTGLAARFMADGTFVLVPATVGPQDNAAQERYYGRVQFRLREALCANSETRPGSYRLVALLWIGTAGKVARYERLGSTGLPERDRNVDLTLGRLAVGAPPPAGFSQPVLVMIVPDQPGITLGCEVGALRRRAP